ncbi:uncharacterized protein [Chelonus insularis]|uniref:uncharacterized protein n=1 Tax=Chelonus insularis TaxID=460826 RepID=UPI00158949E2|nr:uncharacterized protein LOC118068491 [Chelonus insularis]XP_034941828.1 uncharacterized protein LOC118068491 [Chelonus insularis]XP_034941829.1 uncharacterized protein LOC118068491 [Chelonus insularis]
MHFWINKPAGRSRTIGGCRRYQAGTAIPASSFQASIPLLKNRTGRRNSKIRSSVTSSMVSSNRIRSNLSPNSRSCGRCVVYHPRTDDVSSNNAGQSTTTHHGQQTNNIANNAVTNTTHVRRVLPNDPTLNRGIIDFSEIAEISRAELAGYRLRCGVFIIFVLATGFVSIAKFCIGHRPDKGLDVLIFCGLLVTLLISGCFYSTLFRRTRNNHHYHVPEIPIATVTTGVTNDRSNHQCITENLSSTLMPTSPHLQEQALEQVFEQELAAQITLMSTLPRLQQQSLNQHQTTQIASSLHLTTPTPTLPSPSPPPYHIAILIPPSSSTYEAPPPSYEKATR